eukprot:3004091-Rhodomonas_salina.1
MEGVWILRGAARAGITPLICQRPHDSNRLCDIACAVRSSQDSTRWGQRSHARAARSSICAARCKT